MSHAMTRYQDSTSHHKHYWWDSQRGSQFDRSASLHEKFYWAEKSLGPLKSGVLAFASAMIKAKRRSRLVRDLESIYGVDVQLLSKIAHCIFEHALEQIDLQYDRICVERAAILIITRVMEYYRPHNPAFVLLKVLQCVCVWAKVMTSWKASAHICHNSLHTCLSIVTWPRCKSTVMDLITVEWEGNLLGKHIA